VCEWYTFLGVVLVAMVYVRKVLGKGGEVDGGMDGCEKGLGVSKFEVRGNKNFK